MGGMIAQEYALAYGGDLRSLSLCCTYAAPGPFCSRMFALWRTWRRMMGVPTVMRDVTLWAFTQDFFLKREDDAEAVRGGDGGARPAGPCLPVAAARHPGARHDEPAAPIKVPTMVLAGAEDILIPMQLSSAAAASPARNGRPRKGGHAFLWEFPQPFNKKVLDFIGRHR